VNWQEFVSQPVAGKLVHAVTDGGANPGLGGLDGATCQPEQSLHLDVWTLRYGLEQRDGLAGSS
jgi:hypothetical protein